MEINLNDVAKLANKGKEVKTVSLEELPKLQKKNFIFKALVFVCFAFTVACMYMDFTPGVIAGFVLIVVVGGISAGISKQVKATASNNIAAQVFDEVFEDVNYQPFEHISSSDVDSAKFRFSYDKIEGSDLVVAKYKGLNIQMSDVELIDVSTDSDGHRQESTVFKGLWMICDFGKQLVADVQVCERTKLGKLMGKGGIQTENEEFNKHFNIRSENEEEAFYILTPHMMEYIEQMDEKAKAKTNLSFLKNGKLHIALDSHRDAFEVKGFSTDIEKIKAQFKEEIKQITDVIDDLRLVDDLFEK